MKKSMYITAALSLPGILLLSSYRFAEKQSHTYISIESALDDGLIDLRINAIGNCYSGNCITIEITNTKKDSGFYSLEAGRRLPSADTTLQDILVAHSQQFAMRGKEKRHVTVFGFCCQAHHHAPSRNAKYAVGKMASKSLVVLAQYLNRHTYPITAMQSAVWTISDNNQLSSVTASDMDSIHLLLDTIARIKNIDLPWYALTYEKDKTLLFSGRPVTLSADLKFYLANNAVISVNVYDASGTLLTTFSQVPASPQTYFLPISLNVKGWSHGQYSLCVLADNNRILRKTFEL